MELFGDKRTYPGGAGACRFLWLSAQRSLLVFPLAGWGLAAGRIRAWNGTGAVLNSRRHRRWGSRTRGTPQPPPQLLTHRHLLRDSSCLTCEKDKDLERELGVIYYAENMDLICLTENLWWDQISGIKPGDWVKGYGVEIYLTHTPRWDPEHTQLRKLEAGW